MPFDVGQGLIAFVFSDSDEETAAVPIREWDQGKQSPDVEKRGKNRKSGETSRDGRESMEVDVEGEDEPTPKRKSTRGGRVTEDEGRGSGRRWWRDQNERVGDDVTLSAGA